MECNRFKEVLLYSGGLDSYIAYHYLHKPQTLYFSLNHKYQRQELDAIRNTVPNTFISTVFTLGPFEHEDAHIPMRNAFLVMGAVLLRAEKIHLIVQRGEMSIPDRSFKFYSDIKDFLSFLENRPIELFSPFFNMTKAEMVEWYLNAGHSAEDLLKTRSCFSNTVKPCGACGACFRRWVALEFNNIREEMESDILKWEGTKEYIRKIKLGEYDSQRSRETIDVLKMHRDHGVIL